MTAYEMRISDWSSDVCSSDLGQSVKVDEYRLPTMKATITGPKTALVRPAAVPLNLFVGYLSGGPAPNMSVELRTNFRASRSEERRVRNECVSPCRSRWSQSH